MLAFTISHTELFVLESQKEIEEGLFISMSYFPITTDCYVGTSIIPKFSEFVCKLLNLNFRGY